MREKNKTPDASGYTEPYRLKLRGRGVPSRGHVCPSDVNVRWFVDHLMNRQVRRMDDETLADVNREIREMFCLDCDSRFFNARMISEAVTPLEIISGISRFTLSHS